MGLRLPLGRGRKVHKGDSALKNKYRHRSKVSYGALDSSYVLSRQSMTVVFNISSIFPVLRRHLKQGSPFRIALGSALCTNAIYFAKELSLIDGETLLKPCKTRSRVSGLDIPFFRIHLRQAE